MFNLENFISSYVTGRSESLFTPDLENFRDELKSRIGGKSVLVIGGAGSIGSSFIHALLPFNPTSLTVVDLNENGLAELTRDLRSTDGVSVPAEFLSYTMDFDSPVFRRMFVASGGYDIVANFSAHKHVRSEKDKYSVEALLENNIVKARRFMELLKKYPPQYFFCVSTDKAANPVNIMGASKRIMEDLIMAYSSDFNVTTARFANVAFSNGSLPAAFLERIGKRQPIAAPSDVRRYFVSPRESGQICMLACMLGKSGEIFFPKLEAGQMKRFSAIAEDFLHSLGYTPKLCSSDAEAKQFAASMKADTKEWPVVFFPSDTTGEKDYEEFFVKGETLDMDRFHSLGVIRESKHPEKREVEEFIQSIESLFTKPDFTKQEIVQTLKAYLPNFQHEEKGKNLDQKM